MSATRYCSNCGKGKLERYYVRVATIGKSRFFQSVNLYQCPIPSCYAFYTIKHGQLVRLDISEVVSKPQTTVYANMIRSENTPPVDEV